MATAEVNIELTTLSLEESAINKFSELINLHKTQIITRFTQLHDMLHNKQTSLINQLDKLLTDVITHRQTHDDDQLRPLRKAELTHNKLNTVLESTPKQLQDSIDSIENETLDIPIVDIRWDTGNYSTVINNLCKVELLSYSNRTQPIWSTVSKGEGQYELYSPFGLAVDQDSGNIYVADFMAKRIQIYSSIGEYVRTIYTENYKPSRMLLDTEYCYVSSNSRVIKISKLSGNIVNSAEIGVITGMCLDVLDSNRIFMCVLMSGIVLVYNKTDLVHTNSIQLNTEYYTGQITPLDIKLLPAQLIILFTRTDYPLQCFNREGVLLRTIISRQQINFADYFCMDRYNNYIISDCYDNNIKIFTPLGKLISSIGKPGQEIGQFIFPYGICLDLNNKIIICDCKDNYKLQAF